MGTSYTEVEGGTARKIAMEAIQSLGRGFDVTCDFRTKFCKSRVVEVAREGWEKITLPGGVTIDAPKTIKFDKGESMRFTSDLMPFQQMSELFNKRSLIDGKIPLGYFNAMYDFTGSWFEDAPQTKTLAFDGKFVTLYQLQLTRSTLVRSKVKEAVPSTWEPAGIARFISKYGTHIITSVNVGGQDVLFLKENCSSMLSAIDVNATLKGLGDKKFTDTIDQKVQDQKVYGMHQIDPRKIAYVDGTEVPYKSQELVIFARKRGGNLLAKTHSEWQATVNSAPDIISMSFVPITSLLTGTPGIGFLNHAINLYIRYKPPIDDIRCFLEFQVPRQWIPVYNDLPLGPPRKKAALPSLQFSLMGPKLYVNTAQICVNRRPVTGLRLYLEGRRNNRLGIHLQHLSSLPRVLEPYWNENVIIEQPRWCGSDDQGNSDWFEHVHCKNFSHVCTARVKYNPEWTSHGSGVFVITGAKIEVKSHGLKNVLHLRLQFTRVPGCTIQKSHWYQPCNASSQKAGFFSTLSTTFTSHTARKTARPTPVAVNSGVFLGQPPVPIQQPKLLKFVDTRELTKGPHDMPGHWLVIGAQLDVVVGKICLHAKYCLLNYENE